MIGGKRGSTILSNYGLTEGEKKRRGKIGVKGEGNEGRER